MPEINVNYSKTQPLAFKRNDASMDAMYYAAQLTQTKSLKDEFVYQHKKNGLFERLYNGIKNLTGLGVGSKKAQDAVRKAENGEIEETKARDVIDKYRKSQANGEQAFGDLISVGTSGLTFFGVRKFLKMQGAKAVLNPNSENAFKKQFAKLYSSKSKLALVTLGLAAYAGSLSKLAILKFNRIGSDEFKTDKKKYQTEMGFDKIGYKLEKKINRSERRKANFKNILSGAINGLMMPISMLGGAIVGVPAYLLGNSLNRYFVGNHEEKDKSFKGYAENLKNDGITHATLAVATAVPMIKNAKYANKFDKNLEKAIAHLKDRVLQNPNLQGNNTYLQIQELLNNSQAVHKIINNNSLTNEQKALALIDENIFAAKMKQTCKDGSALSTLLKDNCPSSRTLEEAKNVISSTLGNKYNVEKLIGVGTVAETYLAKDSSGKEVCIKILKKGINEEKVLKDKEKVIELIKNSGKPEKEIDNLLKNIDDMSNGLLKELDLSKEMEAAKKLSAYTEIANVVKPIEVKDGIYVMEKAKGISLSSLVELNSAYFMRDALKKYDFPPKTQKGTKLYNKLKNAKTKDEQLAIIEQYIKEIEARTPEFGNINLSKEDYKALIEEYQHVLVEQFNKTNKNGKVIHTDIHAGNIFIDVDALRNRPKGVITDAMSYMGKPKGNKVFTLIDTGNVITMDKEQALRSINLTSYVRNGNVSDIAEYMLNGVENAALGGHTKEEALKLVKDDLSKLFFDNETQLGKMTNESVVEIVSNIMRKHGIVPADTQFTFNKARETANNSLGELYSSLTYFYLKDMIEKIGQNPDSEIKALGGLMQVVAKAAKDAGLMKLKYNKMKSVQETLNLTHLTPMQRKNYKNNPNMLKTNDEKHLIYQLKQEIKPTEGSGLEYIENIF